MLIAYLKKLKAKKRDFKKMIFTKKTNLKIVLNWTRLIYKVFSFTLKRDNDLLF